MSGTAYPNQDECPPPGPIGEASCENIPGYFFPGGLNTCTEEFCGTFCMHAFPVPNVRGSCSPSNLGIGTA